MTEHIAGGYVAVRPSPRPDWPGVEALPDPFISLYDFLCRRGPELTWCGGDDRMTAFGVAPESCRAARTWIDAQERAGRITFPAVSTSADVVRAFVRDFAPAGGARIVGYGLPAGDVDGFLAAYASFAQPGEGLVDMLERRRPMETGGRLLGYEYLAAHLGGLATSWVVHGLPGELGRATGVRVNADGFVDERDRRAADAYVLREDGKEPGVWRAWAVVDYPAG